MKTIVIQMSGLPKSKMPVIVKSDARSVIERHRGRGGREDVANFENAIDIISSKDPYSSVDSVTIRRATKEQIAEAKKSYGDEQKIFDPENTLSISYRDEKDTITTTVNLAESLLGKFKELTRISRATLPYR